MATTSAGAARCRGTSRTSTTCSARPSAAARASRSRAATTTSLIYDPPRRLDVKFDLKYYDKIDTLPNAQNVETTFDRLVTGEVGLYYSDVRRSIGAVDDEKGIDWYAGRPRPTASTTRRSRRCARQPRLRLGPAAGQLVALAAHRGRLASNERDNPVANFYFGGFGNNYVDSRSIKRYREYDSFPGFEINEISGLSFVRPHGRVEPAAGVVRGRRQARASTSRGCGRRCSRPGCGPTRGGRPFRKDYQNAGAQVDLRFSVLHWYEMTLSLGYAVGFVEGRRKSDEWMVSLKIM